MPDVYDQDLEGLAAAEETQAQEAQAAVKAADKPQVQAENKTSAQAQSRAEASTDDSVKLNKEEYADFQRMRQAAQLSQMETDFRKSYPDFDMQKITDKILEIDEKNPGAGDALLTPVGLENVYLKFFHGKAQEQTEDEFDIARGTGGGVDRSEMMRRINKGEISQSEKYAYLSKIFN
ncbi:hypothetical protein [uncultured Campylobacter sp.]|uniref:hypothetical protein n=1 Tax=uncultured Campylobacter sp. TaxID=218934 RepID=UPI00260427C9|nr:hypothetical protein [uncultured Campylobacter sp.]